MRNFRQGACPEKEERRSKREDSQETEQALFCHKQSSVKYKQPKVLEYLTPQDNELSRDWGNLSFSPTVGDTRL